MGIDGPRLVLDHNAHIEPWPEDVSKTCSEKSQASCTSKNCKGKRGKARRSCRKRVSKKCEKNAEKKCNTSFQSYLRTIRNRNEVCEDDTICD